MPGRRNEATGSLDDQASSPDARRWPARVAGLWLRRRWKADPAAMVRWAGLQPAVVVTGASEGIGFEIARRFAGSGRTVALVARRPEPLQKAVLLVRGESAAAAIAVELDVTRSDAAEVLEAELLRHGLYADILVNNAGIGLSGDYTSHPPQRIGELLELNVRALSLLMRHFLPAMCVRGRGGVLNVGSLGGYAPGPYQAAYYASKAYVIALTEAVAWECRGLGVRIAVFAPGPVRTRFHARMGAEGSLYRWLLPAPTPSMAAGSAVRWFGWGRTVITPGIMGPLIAVAMRLTPHVVLVPIVGWLLKPREILSNAGHESGRRG
ncbi:MAG: SDR family NAD(P)-dependent oxidoreductase [Hyphomicrobiaceae bacterium]|nr:SDR family NAD(P)-dependent oxidoreductase [Hyphomicrobiaceae bacterium]